MITKDEKLISIFDRYPIDVITSAYERRLKAESGKIDSELLRLREQGFEEVEVLPDDVMTSDGREVMRVYGRAWALTPSVHAARKTERLEAALEFAKKKEAAREAARQGKFKSPPPGEALASVLCPIDHAVMAKSPVCPKCEKGRAGYKVLCVCTECGHEVYL